MNREQIIKQIGKKISHEIIKQPNRTISQNEPIISSGLIDSFSLVDLALAVEDVFGVHIEDTELNAKCFDSLSELADLVISKKT